MTSLVTSIWRFDTLLDLLFDSDFDIIDQQQFWWACHSILVDTASDVVCEIQNSDELSWHVSDIKPYILVLSPRLPHLLVSIYLSHLCSISCQYISSNATLFIISIENFLHLIVHFHWPTRELDMLSLQELEKFSNTQQFFSEATDHDNPDAQPFTSYRMLKMNVWSMMIHEWDTNKQELISNALKLKFQVSVQLTSPERTCLQDPTSLTPIPAQSFCGSLPSFARRISLVPSQVALYVDTVMHNCTLTIETFAEVYTLSGDFITSILQLGKTCPCKLVSVVYQRRSVFLRIDVSNLTTDFNELQWHVALISWLKYPLRLHSPICASMFVEYAKEQLEIQPPVWVSLGTV